MVILFKVNDIELSDPYLHLGDLDNSQNEAKGMAAFHSFVSPAMSNAKSLLYDFKFRMDNILYKYTLRIGTENLYFGHATYRE
jgi:hypothetical protein